MLHKITAILKFISGKNIVAYILGRFKIIRRCYSAYSKLKQSFRGLPKNIPDERTTFFKSLPTDLALKSLEKDAVFLGLELPQVIVTEIQEFSQNTLLAQADGLTHFYYSDVKNGYLPDGRAMVQGIAINPLACNAIQQIVNDPVLRLVVEKYLGYSPTKVSSLLRWSFVLEIPDKVRMRLNQGNIYHYDVGEFNSVYVNFYLSNTDKYSGAHAMFKSSHNHKTPKMLFNYATQPEEFLIKYYGKENELIIEANAGFGFIQDPYCYHRAIPPIKDERLLLQIQFA